MDESCAEIAGGGLGGSRTPATQVRGLSESDDFDGIAAIGMKLAGYDGVVLVPVRSEVGWWDGTEPYLLFYKGARPSRVMAERLVRAAMTTGSVEFGSCVADPARETPEQPWVLVELDLPDNLEEVAALGMKYGHSYSRVLCRRSYPTVCLLFFNDEATIPDETFEVPGPADLP